jgi:hypothetical protein
VTLPLRERIEYIRKLAFLLQAAFGNGYDAAHASVDTYSLEPIVGARDQAYFEVFRVMRHEAQEHILEPRSARARRFVSARHLDARRHGREDKHVVRHVAQCGVEALAQQLSRRQQTALRFLQQHSSIGTIGVIACGTGRGYPDANEQDR